MADRETNRMEAFSDGVFAIAITLLILEIRVPHLDQNAGNGALVSALLTLWPSLLALVLSFFAILIMWVSHHELMRLVRRVDYQLLFANGFLLLLVTFVPFPTAVLAQYLGAKSGSAAVAFYCLSFFVISIAFKLLLAAIAYKRRLVRPDIAAGVLSRIRRAYWVGPVAYGTAGGGVLLERSGGIGDLSGAMALLDSPVLPIRAPLSKSPAIFSV
jgi:uncharacterized membrane protein